MSEIERIQPANPAVHIGLAGATRDIIVCTVIPEEADGTVRETDIRTQTRLVFAKLSALLESLGSDLQHVLHVTVYLKDMAERPEMNEIWDEVFAPVFPARAALQVVLARPQMRVEITVTAARRQA